MRRVLAALLLTATVGVGNAAPITFTDAVDPTPDHLFDGNGGANAIHNFSHNIVDNGYSEGIDVINAVSITLRFTDDSDDAAAESIAFSFDGVPFGEQVITSGGAIFSATFSDPSLIGLLADGALNVTLENAGVTTANPNGRSDFRFLDSTLSVGAERTARLFHSVPEPNALALFGLALGAGGLMWRVRRT